MEWCKVLVHGVPRKRGGSQVASDGVDKCSSGRLGAHDSEHNATSHASKLHMHMRW